MAAGRSSVLLLLCVRALACRDPKAWPYNATSVWNTPIGGDAVYVPAHLFPGAPPRLGIFVDTDYFVATAGADPLIPWYSQGWWNSTPHCEQLPWSPRVGAVPWPPALTITAGGNNALALLLPDGDSLIFTQPAYRCSPTAPLLGLRDASHGTGSLRGLGNWGGHGGSALNAIGGSLRVGELLPAGGGGSGGGGAAAPPPHVLKLQLWAARYYYGPAHGATWSTCHRWPALVCDGYFMDPALYNGTNAALKPGALLALPPAALPSLLASLSTAPARALAWTLAHYGGLLADDTYADRATFNAEAGFTDAFQAAWGWPFEAAPGDARPGAAAWLADVLALFRALQVVDSNGPGAPGGGGAPLQPPPPPFCPSPTAPPRPQGG